MSLIALIVPAFPDVPLALGVPPVPRDPLGLATAVSNLVTAPPILTADDPSISNQARAAPQWGIFLKGELVLTPDSIIGVDEAKEYRLLDYPLEDGAFQTYNKVEMPRDDHVTATKGGPLQERTDFLTTLQTIAASLDLYDVMTPEAAYMNANIERFNVERDVKSAQLITVRIWLREIRVTATATLSSTKIPASADTVDDGGVQATAPTAPQAAATTGGAM